MRFTRLPALRLPPFFELHMRNSIASLTNKNLIPTLSAKHMRQLRQKIESLLLAECLFPAPYKVARRMHSIFQLLALTMASKPVVYRKRRTLSLLFDATSLQSEMHLDDPNELIVGYTQTMMGFLLFDPAPSHIAMIGLGGGSLAKFCYHHLPQASITVAEISPEVIALRDQFCIPNDDQRFQIRCIDGAEFIEQAESQFDVLMVDGFDKNGQPPQLCSQHFYEKCSRALTPNGIMIVNILGDESNLPELVARIQRAFNGASIVVDALDSLNKIVFAFKGDALNLPEEVLTSRTDILESLHPVVMRPIVEYVMRHRGMPGQRPHCLVSSTMATSYEN